MQTTIKALAPPKNNVERAHVRMFDVDLSAPWCIRWRPGCEPAADWNKAA